MVQPPRTHSLENTIEENRENWHDSINMIKWVTHIAKMINVIERSKYMLDTRGIESTQEAFNYTSKFSTVCVSFNDIICKCWQHHWPHIVFWIENLEYTEWNELIDIFLFKKTSWIHNIWPELIKWRMTDHFDETVIIQSHSIMQGIAIVRIPLMYP